MTQLRKASQKRPHTITCCQVCGVDLASVKAKLYCIQKKVCPQHLQAAEVQLPGRDCLHRFCHQCGKFEPLTRFDDVRRSCRDRLVRRRKPPAGRCSPESSHDSDEDPSTYSDLQRAYTADTATHTAADAYHSPSWSCGYGTETAAACSAFDDTLAMHMDMQLHQMLEHELAACAALSADAPACRLQQLQVQQGLMGMQPASCSAVLSPAPDAAGEEFENVLAAAMQQELQQCLQEQHQAAQGAARSAVQQPIGASARAQQMPDCMSSALHTDSTPAQRAFPAAADAQPWSDHSSNSSTLPVIDVYTGLGVMGQPAAHHAPSAAAVAAADAEALQRQVCLQHLLARQQRLQHAAAAAVRAAESTAAMAGLLGLTAPARMPSVATSAQLPAGSGYRTLSSRASMLPAAGPIGQSTGLCRMPTACSISSAAPSTAAPLMHTSCSPGQQEAAVVQRLDELQGQYEQVAAQLVQLKDMFAERLMMQEHSTSASSGTKCLGMGMF